MKIITPGVLPNKTVHQGLCLKCKAVVEFTTDEATPHHTPKNETYLSVKCPTKDCGQDINVEI